MLVNQWNYTIGVSIKRNINNGFLNLALRRTTLNNDIEKYEDNEKPYPANQTLDVVSAETETKLRLDINTNRN